MCLLPMLRQVAHPQGQGARGEVGHAGGGQHQKAAVLHHQPQALGALAMGPADELLAVDEPQRCWPPDQQGRPALVVMHHLHQRATNLPPAAQVMLVIKQAAHSRHFIRSHRAHLQFLQYHGIRFFASPILGPLRGFAMAHRAYSSTRNRCCLLISSEQAPCLCSAPSNDKTVAFRRILPDRHRVVALAVSTPRCEREPTTPTSDPPPYPLGRT